MKRKLLLSFLLITVSLTSVFAQQVLKGIIKDSNDLPMPGVNIRVKGTTNGSISNIDGEYSVLVKKGETLVFTFIGFVTQEVVVKDFKLKNITLLEDINELDEVVVVGYGEMKKRDLTGALSQIKEEDNVKSQYQSVDQMLQGRGSGIQVIGNDGNQGGAMSVRIRGTNSLRGNNEPLYVVDGVIISTAGEGMANAQSDGNFSTPAQNGLTGINPRDIESIEVLKDASATAIYGSRGANGVVLITTKKGEKGKGKINVYASTTISDNAKQIDVLNGQEYATFINEFNMNTGRRAMYDINPTTGAISSISTGDIYDVHHWQDEVYKTGVSYNAGMSMSGASEKTRYYLSTSYNEQNGTMPVSGSKNANIRLNLNKKVTDKLTVDGKGSIFYNQGSYAQTGSKTGGNASLINQTVMKNPLTGGEEGIDESNDSSNPVSIMENNDDLTEEIRTNLSGNLKYKFSKHFSYQLRLGADIRNKTREIWYGPGTFLGDQKNGVYNYSGMNRKAFTIDNLFNFNKTFNKVHKINAVAGVTYDGVYLTNTIYSVSNFSTPNFRTERPDLGNVNETPYYKEVSDYTMNSYLARLNYSFKNKFIITASMRADGSSKFKGDNKWGYFPSVSTAWYVSDENFLKNQETLSNLKLRAGWGRVGNSSLQPYQTWTNYHTGRYVDASGNTIIGVYPTNIENPDLTWETTEQLNIGVDFGFLKDRINVTVDAYEKKTTDLLQRLQTPPSSGYSNYFVNNGEMYNRGLEISTNIIAVDKNDFQFSLNGNINFNRTEVGDLGVPSSKFYMNGYEVEKQMIFGSSITTGNDLRGPANIFVQGEQMGLIYGFETNGIYQTSEAADAGPTLQGKSNQAGDVAFVDQNGDGNITDADKTVIGNPNPDFTYAFGFNMSYKGLSLNVLFNGVYGNDIVNAGNAFYGYAAPMYGGNNITQEAYYNAWRPGDKNASHPRVGYGYENGTNGLLTDRIVEDGSYLRLSSVTLGYDIPTEKLGLKRIRNMNIYVTGKNLLTFTDYSGYDPEITSYLFDGTILGVDWQTYPNIRSFIFGFNMTF